MSTTTESLTPNEIQSRLKQTKRELRRLERVRDPGEGRPPGEARVLREQHLRRLESATAEMETLAAQWQATDPQVVERESMLDRARRFGFRREVQKLHDTPEERSFHAQLYENMNEREAEREATREREDAADRALHPGDPRASSIAAAVLADDVVLDMLGITLRRIEDTDEFTTTNLIDAHDAGVLVACLHLLADRNPLVFEGWAQHARWPRREPPIAPVEHLRESVVELKRAGFLSLHVEAGTAHVSYGPRTREICTRWGIEIGEGS